MCMSREKVGTTEWEDHTSMIPTSPSHLRVSRVNRVVSRRLAHRGKWSEEESHAAKVGVEERETAWHLSESNVVVGSSLELKCRYRECVEGCSYASGLLDVVQYKRIGGFPE